MKLVEFDIRKLDDLAKLLTTELGVPIVLTGHHKKYHSQELKQETGIMAKLYKTLYLTIDIWNVYRAEEDANPVYVKPGDYYTRVSVDFKFWYENESSNGVEYASYFYNITTDTWKKILY